MVTCDNMKYLLLLAFLLIPAASAQAVWFDSSWPYRVKIEVVPSKVATSSQITDFPVYVSLGDLPSGFWSNAQSDGDDIRVVESDEVTETPFQLVTFETASSSGELHFLADSLATTSTSTFYIYYGNSGASGYASTSAYGSQNVWNSNYRAVYHLSETGTTTARGFQDSTDYDNAGTGVSLGSSNTVAGKVGRSIDFDGSADYISFANESNFDFERTNNFSGSVWVSIDSTAAANVVVGKINDSGCYNGWELWLDSSRRPLLILGNCYPSNQLEVRSNTGAPATAWTHLAWSYSGGSAPSNILLYINGQLSATTTTFNSLSSTILNNASAYVGRRVTNWPFNGRKDEVRIATAALSQAWFQTEFNNISTTTAFYVVGAQTTDSGGGPATSTATSTDDGTTLFW